MVFGDFKACSSACEWTITVNRSGRAVLLRAEMSLGAEAVRVNMTATPDKAEEIARLLLLHAEAARSGGQPGGH
jgi:hypothetical protein